MACIDKTRAVRFRDRPRTSRPELKFQKETSPLFDPETTNLESGEKVKQVISFCAGRGLDLKIFVPDVAFQTCIIEPQPHAMSIPWGQTAKYVDLKRPVKSFDTGMGFMVGDFMIGSHMRRNPSSC